MKAIGFERSLPIEETNSLIAFETDTPTPAGKDIRVKIEAVSVNPVDYKIRQNSARGTKLSTPKIMGWDAVGTVDAVGDKVTLFAPGDRVFYAGDITRPGSNATHQLVDEKIVGHAPKSVSAAAAAALPLTALTAWETLFDRMKITADKDKEKSLLIIGGAGGVGSIAIQLAKKVAGLNAIATASRTESVQWCQQLGADHVVNHHSLVEEVRKAGFEHVDFIADFVDTNYYWDAMAELIKPQGHIASITGSSEPVALNKLKAKSASFSWELMFTRSQFHTEDRIAQHRILNAVAQRIDKGDIRSTANHTLEGFTVENFKRAHRQLESGKTIGKIVIVY